MLPVRPVGFEEKGQSIAHCQESAEAVSEKPCTLWLVERRLPVTGVAMGHRRGFWAEHALVALALLHDCSDCVRFMLVLVTPGIGAKHTPGVHALVLTRRLVIVVVLGA